MATLVFSMAGAAIGASLGGAVFGVSSAVIGRAIGGMIGRSVDQALLGPTQIVTGPRLDNMDVQTSQEGTELPVVEGRGRIAGKIIWATRFEEVTTTTKSGGKGAAPKVKSTEYTYFANFAIALTDCATGPIQHFGRIWADGKPLDMSELTVRFYNGTKTQTPDPLIVAKDGSAPAYRGVSYVVFERLPVGDYGRRIPNLTFEVWGPSGEMENLIQGVDIIPGSTEFGYSPTVVERLEGSDTPFPLGDGVFSSGTTTVVGRDNAIRDGVTSDWNASLDQLQGVLPNCNTVALVISWFGTDLRAGHCQIEPRVEIKNKYTKNRNWSASGLSRSAANLVSYIDGRPAFGSAPDDQSVFDAIQDLRARGFRVVLYPFIMMDIPQGNTLPDPETIAPGQLTYPWRGRIQHSTDIVGDGAITAQINSFLGLAAPANFSSGATVPTYSGPSEWSYRRFILHLASLARNAGGVDAFLIGSELVGLTSTADGPASYPFVDGLVDLAADVKSLLPGADISYAADWSEYHSHRNGGEVFFNMDSLWSSANVDFIGIDNYLPISDWRHGTEHADYSPESGVTSPYLLDYLKDNIEGGEYFDWYYASDSDRINQIRTPISDGAHGEDWIYRQKAIRDWRASPHHNRPGGVRDATPTAWVPNSKPVWFTEFGCPAINLGSNQPNVYYDANSSESSLPHFSNGVRDDFMQRQYTRAMLEWWRDNGGAAVSPANMLVWAWDARPWPEFPRLDKVWSDGGNWQRGHWLNGRAGNAPAAEIIQRRLETHYGYSASKYDLSYCFGQADGMILPGPLSFREMLGTWETALRLDASEYGGIFQVSTRSAARFVAEYGVDSLVEHGESPLYTISRSSQEETPRAAVVRYLDTDRDYQPGAARATIRENPGHAESVADLALVSDIERMANVAAMILRTAADARETAELTLPPSSNLKPGEVFHLIPRDGQPIRFIADQVTMGVDRKVRASLYSGAAYSAYSGPLRIGPDIVSPASSVALPYLLDLPILPRIEMDDHQGIIAFHSDPWPGGCDLYQSVDSDTGYGLNIRTGLAGTVGETISAFKPGRTALWSGQSLEVKLYSGAFITRSELDVLNGANAIAIEHSYGDWEIVQFQEATLIATDTWRLTGFLRGQLGTEWLIGSIDLPSGARVVSIDAGIAPVEMIAADINRPLYWRAVPVGRDPAGAVTFSHTFKGIGRRPYAPAHLSASIDAANLTLDWVRRTRIDGDSWLDAGDVPLGEEFERYLVEIGPAGSPDISQEVSDATTAVIDVSGLSGGYEVRVAQISATFGPGAFVISNITV